MGEITTEADRRRLKNCVRCKQDWAVEGYDVCSSCGIEGGGRKLEADPVNHPGHYTNHPSGIECIEITRHMSFNLGNAIKYIWRADLKGNSIEDLKKAVWYINDEIKRREKK